MKRAKLIILGTSAATPKPSRALPALYFEHEGQGVLMDCGEGTQFQIMKAKIPFSRIKAVVITHSHGDHVLGLPGLIETMAMGSRREPLTVIGPSGTAEFLKKAFEYTKFWPSFTIKVYEGPAEINLGRVKVSTFPVDHGVEAYGVKVETVHKRKVKFEELEALGVPRRLWGKLQAGEAVEWEGRLLRPEEFTVESEPIKVVYSGDTRPCERLVEEAKGADVLVHEATFLSDMAEEAHERGHSTAKDAAEIALKANVKMLLLTHFSNRYEDLRRHLEEARRFFPNAYLADDLVKVVILKR